MVTALAKLRAGASAVQVGTATFADPAAPMKVQREVLAWAREHGIARTTDVAALT